MRAPSEHATDRAVAHGIRVTRPGSDGWSHQAERRPDRHRRRRLRRLRRVRARTSRRPISIGWRSRVRDSPISTPHRSARRRVRRSSRDAISNVCFSSGRWGTSAPSWRKDCPPPAARCQQLVRNNGYATGLIGKWHLGFKPEFGPNAHGFGYFFGFLSGYIDFYQHTRGSDNQSDLYENTTPIHEEGYMTDLITGASDAVHHRACCGAVLSRGDLQRGSLAVPAAGSSIDGPAQLDVSECGGLGTRHAQGLRGDDRARRRRRRRASRACSTASALRSRTLVIFTNDNGGEWLSRNAPLFHRKDTLWEGGIRVPAIFRWPGRSPRRTNERAGRHHHGPHRDDSRGDACDCAGGRATRGDRPVAGVGASVAGGRADAVLAHRHAGATAACRATGQRGSSSWMPMISCCTTFETTSVSETTWPLAAPTWFGSFCR